ncbi:MAG: prolyl oligopeptidase family serine peptidase [Verrucomicrobiota bacterium]
MKCLTLLFSFILLYSFTQAQIPGYPEGVTEVSFLSQGDDTEQPALFWKPKGSEKVPLLVALHTWSHDYMQAGGEAVYARWCQQQGWAFIHPNFRGKNNTPESMGSDLAVADVLSSIDYAKAQANIDPDRIYCIGVSGGGHMSLLMAGRAPEIWAGVSAWCPISDIGAWHAECASSEKFTRYSEFIETALGGDPTETEKLRADAQHRSPNHWLNHAQSVNLDINHGIHDGRTGSVPFTHALRAWNAVVEKDHQFGEKFIAEYYQSQKLPKTELAFSGEDKLYGEKAPAFRKVSGNTRLTLFDGGHEMIHSAALNWLNNQRRNEPAVWEIRNAIELKTEAGESDSGQ